MVLDIKMCRFDNVPWGFRLVGGADYDYPLTVVKVTEGSIADAAGLRVEDVIVRINDTAAMPLTHDEANRIIMNSGSVFYFGVYRENEEDAFECAKKFPLSATASELTMLGAGTEAATPETPTGPQLCIVNAVGPEDADAAAGPGQATEVEVQSADYGGVALYLPELPDRPCSALSERAEIKLVEEEIAAVLSGESELLKEHNVLGIFPKPGVCMTSDVLRSLNEELTKTKLEKEKENRKWSTFLQKPNRPVPKSKQQLEAERRAANAYKVQIVRSAPRDKTPQPEVPAAPKEATTPEPSKEPTPTPTPPSPQPTEDEEPLPADSELPNLEQLPGNGVENENANIAVATDVQSINSNDDEQLEKTDALKDENDDAAGEVAADESAPTPKSEEELALEKQLADVQKQLAALSTLPSTIQSTLDAVTKQLAELLPTFKLQQQLSGEKLDKIAPQIDECNGQQQVAPDAAAGVHTAAAAAVDRPEPPSEVECAEIIDAGEAGEAGDANDLEVAEISRTNGDEQGLKKQKTCQQHDVIEELEQHLVRKQQPRRSKRAFGPLTPSSERPLVLPGGRRWYRPKDAYNDEFIAEILSGNAELITGNTLGVNFMKYQKPERKIDLNRSEVYKVIHHLDRAPIRGIEVRAPLVAAESDIRQALQS